MLIRFIDSINDNNLQDNGQIFIIGKIKLNKHIYYV